MTGLGLKRKWGGLLKTYLVLDGMAKYVLGTGVV